MSKNETNIYIVLIIRILKLKLKSCLGILLPIMLTVVNNCKYMYVPVIVMFRYICEPCRPVNIYHDWIIWISHFVRNDIQFI